MLDATQSAVSRTRTSPTLQRLRFEVRDGSRVGFARRFIAGETIDEAVDCVEDLPARA
jgi:hypothetical protein